MAHTASRPGPLAGLRVIELAAIGPVPFAAMQLADLGADVLRIDRAVGGSGGVVPTPIPGDIDVLGRGRRSVVVDLKKPAGVDVVLALAEKADVFVEGFRPGVVERLGVGPDECQTRNPRLVYGRMTGWGQDGPLAHSAGHDIGYIALSGALHPIGKADEPPLPPANLVGDFGGGGMLLTIGVLAALFERSSSGAGEVIDSAMVDGSALLTTMLQGLFRAGRWKDERESNVLDGAAPFYATYETADGRYIAVGAVEPHFYAELVRLLGVDVAPAAQNDRSTWPTTRKMFAAAFAGRTRAEWCELFEGTDACFAPVMSLAEAPQHIHNRERGTFIEVGGVLQPAPAPRFTRTPTATPTPAPAIGGEGVRPLVDWGVQQTLIDRAIAGMAVSMQPSHS